MSTFLSSLCIEFHACLNFSILGNSLCYAGSKERGMIQSRVSFILGWDLIICSIAGVEEGWGIYDDKFILNDVKQLQF